MNQERLIELTMLYRLSHQGSPIKNVRLSIPRWCKWSRICLPMQETPEMRVQSLGPENPLKILIQYSCLENSLDRAWQATAHGVAESDMIKHMHTAESVTSFEVG